MPLRNALDHELATQKIARSISPRFESPHHDPHKMWERLWYWISKFQDLSRKINAINRLTGDPYAAPIDRQIRFMTSLFRSLFTTALLAVEQPDGTRTLCQHGAAHLR